MKHDQPRQCQEIGGVSTVTCRAVGTGSHAPADFDREVDAGRQVLDAERPLAVDGPRRGIEAVREADDRRLTGRERWIRPPAGNPLAVRVVSEAELAAAYDAGHPTGWTLPASDARGAA